MFWRNEDGEDMAPAPEEATRQQVESAIVEWRTARAERLAQDKIAAKLKEEETTLKQWIIDALRLQAYEGVVVGGRITTAVPKEQPVCSDRSALSQYILDTGSLELLQFRLSTTAISEHMAAGEQIPGIQFVEVFELSDKKA